MPVVFLALNGFALWGFILRGPRSPTGPRERHDYVHAMPAADATPVLAGWEVDVETNTEEAAGTGGEAVNETRAETADQTPAEEVADYRTNDSRW